MTKSRTEMASRIRAEMARREIPVATLAKTLGVAPNTIVNWRSGQNEPRTLEMAIRLADALEMPIEWLLGQDQRP